MNIKQNLINFFFLNLMNNASSILLCGHGATSPTKYPHYRFLLVDDSDLVYPFICKLLCIVFTSGVGNCCNLSYFFALSCKLLITYHENIWTGCIYTCTAVPCYALTRFNIQRVNWIWAYCIQMTTYYLENLWEIEIHETYLQLRYIVLNLLSRIW
jgi:hypothetical protein